jgi:hypothetical protein
LAEACVPNKYLHARYYDPQLGIFLSPDPIGVAGGMNQYGYGLGNPVNGWDRSGLVTECFYVDAWMGEPSYAGYNSGYFELAPTQVMKIQLCYDMPDTSPEPFGEPEAPHPTGDPQGTRGGGQGQTGDGTCGDDSEGGDSGDDGNSGDGDPPDDPPATPKPECRRTTANCLANCIETERFDLKTTLGTAGAALGIGTMPKTAAEIGKGAPAVPRGRMNPYTSQASRWAGRIGRVRKPEGHYGPAPKGSFRHNAARGLRGFGRSVGGRVLGGLATAALVFEGYYNIGAMGRCTWVCTENPCSY